MPWKFVDSMLWLSSSLPVAAKSASAVRFFHAKNARRPYIVLNKSVIMDHAASAPHDACPCRAKCCGKLRSRKVGAKDQGKRGKEGTEADGI